MKAYLFALIALCVAADIKFDGNVSFSDEEDFAYRHTALAKSAAGVFYTSGSVDASVADEAAKAKADFLLGFISGGAAVVGPVSVLGYFKGQAEVSASTGSFDGALGMSAISYLSLDEYNEDGQRVKTNLFKFGGWSEPKVIDKEKNLQVVETTTSLGEGKLTFYFLTSDVVGRLNLASGIVAPQTIEMIMKLEGYKYADDDNHLRLTMLSGAANATTAGNALISGAEDGMYVTLSSDCYVGSKKKEVTISEYVPSKEGFKLDGVINLGANFEMKAVTVDFPAGKTEISYDPALGHGALVYGASAALFPSIMLILAILAMLLF